MVWYYADGDRQRGPISDEEFQEMVTRGRIREETLVWKDGMDNWQPLKSASEAGLVTLNPASAMPPGGNPSPYSGGATIPAPAAPGGFAPTGAASVQGYNCSQCGRGPLTPQNSVRLGNLLLCSQCDEDMARHYHLTGASTGLSQHASPWGAPAMPATYAVPYASLVTRLGAKIIDTILLSILVQIIARIFINTAAIEAIADSGANQMIEALRNSDFDSALTALIEIMNAYRPLSLTSLLISLLYNAVLVAFFGATLGKMGFRMRVGRPDGSPVTASQAVIRAAVPVLLQIPAIMLPGNGIALLIQFVYIVGIFMALFDSQKRTLYDHIAGTRVLKN